jgi:hypothetical protein
MGSKGSNRRQTALERTLLYRPVNTDCGSRRVWMEGTLAGICLPGTEKCGVRGQGW